MTRSIRRVRTGARIILAVLALGGWSTQQQAPIRGQVLGIDGRPLAGQEVMLHRVTEAGGATVTQTVTDSVGRFELRAPEDAGTGVFFVTTRWQGAVQIGPMLRPPFAADADYVLQVGANTGLGGVMPPEPPPPPRRPAGETAFILAALVALLASSAWIGLRAAGPSRRRRLLMRLAHGEIAAARDSSADRVRIIERLRSP